MGIGKTGEKHPNAIEQQYYETLTDEECLKLLQNEVEKRMEALDLFIKDEEGNFELDDNGDRCVKLGACHIIWDIEKHLMKERFGRNWQSPADKHPDILFD